MQKHPLQFNSVFSLSLILLGLQSQFGSKSLLPLLFVLSLNHTCCFLFHIRTIALEGCGRLLELFSEGIELLDDFQLFFRLSFLVVLNLCIQVLFILTFAVSVAKATSEISFGIFGRPSSYLIKFPLLGLLLFVDVEPVGLHRGCGVVEVCRLLEEFLLLDQVDNLHVVNA